VCGYSVPATEHSVACSFGKEHENEYFLNVMKIYPTGLVSIVSDTYDVFNFVGTMSATYRELIVNRNGTVVFRPDSGDPIIVNSRLIDILWNTFGGTIVNGFKLLIPQVRLIQGDGIDRHTLLNIMEMLISKGYSVDNIVFGSGGGLLQKFNRDTNKFAIKASHGERIVDGVLVKYEISKDPITSKSKRSKAGELKLIKTDSGFTTVSSVDYSEAEFNAFVDELEVVFEDGEILREQNFVEIRELSEFYLNFELK
jgi:nicotinamide phosphoribosyltransferase